MSWTIAGQNLSKSHSCRTFCDLSKKKWVRSFVSLNWLSHQPSVGFRMPRWSQDQLLRINWCVWCSGQTGWLQFLRQRISIGCFPSFMPTWQLAKVIALRREGLKLGFCCGFSASNQTNTFTQIYCVLGSLGLLKPATL